MTCGIMAAPQPTRIVPLPWLALTLIFMYAFAGTGCPEISDADIENNVGATRSCNADSQGAGGSCGAAFVYSAAVRRTASNN